MGVGLAPSSRNLLGNGRLKGPVSDLVDADALAVVAVRDPVMTRGIRV